MLVVRRAGGVSLAPRGVAEQGYNMQLILLPSSKGRDDYPILAAMAAWGDRWLTGPEGTPLVLHHTAGDQDMRAAVVCSECDVPIDVRQVRAKVGPGYRARREAAAR